MARDTTIATNPQQPGHTSESAPAALGPAERRFESPFDSDSDDESYISAPLDPVSDFKRKDIPPPPDGVGGISRQLTRLALAPPEDIGGPVQEVVMMMTDDNVPDLQNQHSLPPSPPPTPTNGQEQPSSWSTMDSSPTTSSSGLPTPNTAPQPTTPSNSNGDTDDLIAILTARDTRRSMIGREMPGDLRFGILHERASSWKRHMNPKYDEMCTSEDGRDYWTRLQRERRKWW